MKLPQYSKYKNSEVQWIGKIPEKWEIRRIKDNLEFEIGGTPATGKEEYYDGDNLWVSISDMKNNPLIVGTKTMISKEGILNSNVKKILKGSLLFSFKLSVGYVSFSNTDLYTNEAIASFLVNKKINLHYLKYILKQDFEENGFENIYGAKLFNKSLIGFAKHVLPETYKEQTQIASFLDSKIQNIDQSIEKVKLIKKLLKEKRLALIGNIILDPNMQKIRLEHVVNKKHRSISRKVKASYVPLGLYNWGRGIFHKIETKEEDLGDSTFCYVQENDLILSGQFAWEGAVAMASSKEEGCVVSHRFPIIRGKKEVLLTEYLWAFFTSKKGDFILNECSIGSAGRNRPLNMNRLMKEKIPVPKLEVQKKIVKIVKKEKELDLLYKKFIKIMEEYKKSLIHHVVTGKVDVRGVEA